MPKTILHMHNVSWLGGVTTFIVDIAAAFPEFTHKAFFIRNTVDKKTLEMFGAAGIESARTPQPVKPSDIAMADPALVIWHNVSGIRLEGKHPWGWIREWPSIHWHHSAVRPTIPMDLHLFVSRHVAARFDGLINKLIKAHDVIPPCINTDRYRHIHGYRHSPHGGDDFVIGKISPNFNADKHPKELLELAKRLDIKLLSPGSDKWYGVDDHLISPTPSWEKVPEWLADMSVLVFMNKKEMDPETWCRSVTEGMAAGLPIVAENAGGITEQITDMENGVLVSKGNFEEAYAAVTLLRTRPKLRRQLGLAAIEWANENASIRTLRRRLGPHILRLLAK